MILAAAACAAAGISYIFNNDEQSINPKYERVTASSTIIDKQGIVKYVIHPRLINPLIKINKLKSNRLKLPIENNKQINNLKKDFSVIFFWSIPLKARLLQIPAKSCLVIENLNPFQRNLMKISIGIQNETSEIALSNSDDTLDSLSYNPIINNHIIPIGILKKNKLDLNERENNQKKFCFDKNLNEENIMRNIILENVNLCVENLSKILSESCSNTEEEQLTTLQNSSSVINNNQHKSSITFLKHEEILNSDHNERERLFDGIILHRGNQFGIELGEPMIRKSNENFLINSSSSSHSINELNRLLSKTNCLLMQQYQIKSIEDLIRLYLKQGQEHFTELMINLFKVDLLIVEQLNRILLKWAKQLT